MMSKEGGNSVATCNELEQRIEQVKWLCMTGSHMVPANLILRILKGED